MMKQMNRWMMALAAAVTLAAGSMAAQTTNPEAAPPDRHLVFAHYMACFGNSVEGYKQEIELAQRHGIDGFAVNCGGWRQKDAKTGEWQDGSYVKSAERLYEAAKQLNSGFKLFFSADAFTLGDLTENMGDMVVRFYDHPNQFRHGDRRVISAWAGTPESYRKTIDKLKAEGRLVCFVPFLYSPKCAMAWSPETVARFFAGQPHMDGLFNFAADGTAHDLIQQNANGRRVTQQLGKIFMAGAAPAYNSANLRDFRGMGGYGAMWQGIIRDDADWVELVAWNDYQEDTSLMAWHNNPSGATRYLFDRDESYLHVTGYYSAWFKSGRPPAIAQDRLFVTYRNRSKWLRQGWDGKQWVDITLMPNSGPGVNFTQMHDDAEDRVYIDTFLTAPAELTVLLGKDKRRFELPAGIGHAEVPLVPGVPRITLERGGKVLAQVLGRRQVIDKATARNSGVMSFHANRTWASGTAIGPVAKRLEAEAGTLGPGASVVKEGGRTAVQTAAVKDSGFTVPVAGLETATYNVRIIYSNPSGEDARLTLFADGAPRAAKDYPYFIPAFLPPTEKGAFETVSFFWSLYAGTRTVKLLWQDSMKYGKPEPEGDDYGAVQVDAIELIKVEPVTRPAPRVGPLPELVPIPGGSFTMGSEAGKPDERPRHKVTISPFAIGRYEVTNEEFERFDPAHRELRDGYSWRSREPVIYVSWTEAAKYCNWLSREAGLTPAYVELQDEKTKAKQWQVKMDADGFRLPTEAEWEYVASGRGEGRKYPWGNDAPVPGRHGNYQGHEALSIDARSRSTPDAGVMVVGSYPDGASRDGVMDLLGNVSEWCSDWFQYYTPEDKVDPCTPTPSHYRSIRGSSWGYYGYPAESTARELNNGDYGGYIYIGFRVALPEAGWKKLGQKP